jgi:hypothetical protein
MAQFSFMYNVELTKGPAVVQLGQLYAGDVQATKIGAIVTNEGSPVTLGGSCRGIVNLANGTSISVDGTVSGNTCYISLPSTVYTVPGPVEIYVSSTSVGQSTTLVSAFGNIRRTQIS